VVFSPDSRYLAASDSNVNSTEKPGEERRRIHVWEAESGRLILDATTNFGRWLDLAFSPDGRQIAGWDGRALRIWPVIGLRVNQTIRGHADRIAAAGFTSDGKHLVTADVRGRVRSWELAPSPPGNVIRGPDGAQRVNLRGFGVLSPDASCVAVYSSVRFITIWELDDRVRLRFSEHDGRVTHVRFHPDGQLVASVDELGAVKLWDSATGTVRQQWNWPTPPRKPVPKKKTAGSMFNPPKLEGQYWLVFSGDGRRLAVVNAAGGVRVYDAGSGREVFVSDDRTTRLADLGVDSGVPPDAGIAVAMNHGGDRLAAVLRQEPGDTIQLWDLASSRPPRTLTIPRGKVGYFFRFTPDGQRLVAEVGDVGEPAQQSLRPESRGRVAFKDVAVHVWDAGSGEPLFKLTSATGLDRTLAISPDGTRLVTWSYERDQPDAATGKSELAVWDLIRGTELSRLRGHTGTVSSAAFSSDGRRIASIAFHETHEVKLWDAATGRELMSLEGNNYAANASVAFNPSGTQLVAVSNDGPRRVHVWDATPRRD
jgi:WD40 repeat protein